MREYLRHRYAVAVPFLLLGLVTVIGGLVSGVTARGQLLDEYGGQPVPDGTVRHGARQVVSDAEGRYEMTDVPRTSILRIDASGFLATSAPGHGGDVRLRPLSLTVMVTEAGSGEPVASAQIRQGTSTLGATAESGSTVISPHPGREAVLLVCAKDFATQEVTAPGARMTVELARQAGADCPVIPTPSPSPSPSPSPAPSPGPASPSPSPPGSPTPTASP